jgi:hypothetical protein
MYKGILRLFQLHVHGSDFTSLYEQVPKEILPTEYGGESGSLQENWGMVKNNRISKNMNFLSVWRLWRLHSVL